MNHFVMLGFFISFNALCNCQSEILPNCSLGGQPVASDRISTLVQSLKINNGLHLETSCIRVKDGTRVKSEIEEFLYNEMIQFESVSNNSGSVSKDIITVNKTKGFSASLSARDSTCNGFSAAGSWNTSSLSLFDSLKFNLTQNYISLAWVLQNAPQMSWVEQPSDGKGLLKFVSCPKGNDGSYPVVQINFFEMTSGQISLDSILEVMVAFSKQEYYLFSVFNADYIEDTTVEQLQQNLGLFQPPNGVGCTEFTYPENHTIEPFGNSVSLSSEIVDFEAKTVVYTSEIYNYDQELARIELHSGGKSSHFVSPRFADPAHSKDPVKLIHDFKSGQVFWVDMQTGYCDVTPMETYSSNQENVPDDMQPSKCSNDSIGLDCVKMYHPNEIYSFDGYKFAGKCQSQSAVPGHRFIKLISDSTRSEACFADGTWQIGSVKSVEHCSLPFYIKTYNLTAPRKAPDFEPVVKSVIHIYDVDFTPPDASYFDISSCFSRPDSAKHFALGSHSITKRFNPETNQVIKDSTDVPFFWKLPRFTANLRSVLQQKLNVAPIRIFDLFVEEPVGEEENKEHKLVIGFGILDIPKGVLVSEASQFSMEKSEMLYRPIKQVEEDIKNMILDQSFKMNFTWADVYRKNKGNDTFSNEEGNFLEAITVLELESMDADEFKDRSDAAKAIEHSNDVQKSSGGIGAGALVATAGLMLVLGAAIGVAIGYKLWKSGTSFGYTIHTNI